jgi:hypothetical protein
MPSPQPVPAALIALGREAVEAVASTEDMTIFRGIASHNPTRDSIFQPLPSYETAKDAISAVPLVADRYGSKDAAGDRLTLQFIYQLFPRTSCNGVGKDVRRLWQSFLAELRVSDWVYRGVANLRNFAVENNVPNPLRLSEGVMIRRRSLDELRSLGFNAVTLDALGEDWSEGGGASPYVICVEHSVPKSPENLISRSGIGFVAARRAITAFRLASTGDIVMGPMWFTRPAKFNVGVAPSAFRGGSTLPSAGNAAYLLTRTTVRAARSLQAEIRYLDYNSYDNGPGNLYVALQSFLSTYERIPPGQAYQLVDTITAAEAMLSDGINTFKLAFRIAGLLGRTDAERVQVFKDIIRFYNIRNKIVHGDGLKEAQLRALTQVDDVRQYIRRLLVAFVGLAASSTPTRYTKQFFREDLDTELQDQQARRRMLRDLGLMR